MAHRKLAMLIAVGGGPWFVLGLAGCSQMRPIGTLTTGNAGGGAGSSGDGGDVVDAGRGGADGGGDDQPIQVLVWNNALAYGHASRALAIPYFQARERTDNIKFDLTYAHVGTNYRESQSDTTFDASVFTDDGLAKYDVILFLNTTGNTIDDDMKTVRRQALQDFMEKKGGGFVGVHSATDTYQSNQSNPWPWYVDFIGTNWTTQSPSGTSGSAQYYQGIQHPILKAAGTPNPWDRSDEWFVFDSDPLISSHIAGIAMVLTCHDKVNPTERPSAWVHEMPQQAGGRMFYTAFGHLTAAFQEPQVMDLIIAGIKWAAHRL